MRQCSHNRVKVKDLKDIYIYFFSSFVIEASFLRISLFGDAVSFMTIFNFTITPVGQTGG